MKRRKTVSRYHVDNNGQITKTSGYELSKNTQSMLGIMALSEMIRTMTDGDYISDDETSDDVINDDKVDKTMEE